jgi:phosphatidate cytidylyltransferase
LAAPRNLTRRVVSALILAPAGIAVAYWGGWPFGIICGIAAGAMLWEWTCLAVGVSEFRILVPGLCALALATIMIGTHDATVAVAVIALGAALAAGLTALSSDRAKGGNAPLWGAAGVVYAGMGLLGPAVLRGDPEFGFPAILFLFAVVWATDICAYLIGRALGGPRLWPQISPNKTWSGALGGLLGGVAAGTLVAYASVRSEPAAIGLLALVLSFASQGGDLLESKVKRRFGAKDAGTLIPGHGGVMDRLDGFLVAALVAVAIGLLRGGLAAPARGLLVW